MSRDVHPTSTESGELSPAINLTTLAVASASASPLIALRTVTSGNATPNDPTLVVPTFPQEQTNSAGVQNTGNVGALYVVPESAASGAVTEHKDVPKLRIPDTTALPGAIASSMAVTGAPILHQPVLVDSQRESPNGATPHFPAAPAPTAEQQVANEIATMTRRGIPVLEGVRTTHRSRNGHDDKGSAKGPSNSFFNCCPSRQSSRESSRTVLGAATPPPPESVKKVVLQPVMGREDTPYPSARNESQHSGVGGPAKDPTVLAEEKRLREKARQEIPCDEQCTQCLCACCGCNNASKTPGPR